MCVCVCVCTHTHTFIHLPKISSFFYSSHLIFYVVKGFAAYSFSTPKYRQIHSVFKPLHLLSCLDLQTYIYIYVFYTSFSLSIYIYIFIYMFVFK